MMPYNENFAKNSMNRYAMQQQQQQQMQSPLIYQQSQPTKAYYQNNQLDAFQPFSNHQLSTFQPDNMFGNIMQSHNKMMKNMNKMVSKMEKQFGMFDMTPFGNFGSQILKDFDRNFTSFSGMHDDLFRNGTGPATMVSKTYVHTKKKDANGQFYEEAQFSNNVAQRDHTGQTISERQQAYKNSATQEQIIAQERMLNNQGRKFVKQRFGNKGEGQEKNYLYNLSDNNINDFDQRWNSKSQQNNFKQISSQYFGGVGNGVKYITDASYKPQNIYSNQNEYYDDSNHGHHIPYEKKLPDQPVRYQQKPAYFPRQVSNDLQPVQVAYANNNQPQQVNAQRNNNVRQSVRQNQPVIIGGQRQNQGVQMVQPGIFKNKPQKNQLPNIG